jgi:hypothetical protein
MTAVEFLQEALSIHLTHEQEMQFIGLFQQVLEMEKQQIEKAKDKGYDDLYITFEDYDSICSDGCCHDFGTITTLNGIELECHNQDTESILMQILLHLNYNVTIEYK